MDRRRRCDDRRLGLNDAVTLRAALIVVVHESGSPTTGVQSPAQAWKSLVSAGAAVKTTTFSGSNGRTQVGCAVTSVPQSTPTLSEVTDPAPIPVRVTVGLTR